MDPSWLRFQETSFFVVLAPNKEIRREEMQNAMNAHKQYDFLLHLSSRFISYSALRTCYIRILNKQSKQSENNCEEQIYDNFELFGLWLGCFFFGCAFGNTDLQ